MKKIVIGIVVVVILIAGYVGITYNRFVTLNESADTQWAQVESQYQRRLDLIPNLVNSVKGSMKQEVEVFSKIADARANYAGARNVSEKVAATAQVESSLSRLLVVMEQYPELKSSEAVQTLMAQIEGTENRVAVERGRYNDTIKAYNIGVKRFPGSAIASMFGFEAKELFQSTAGAEKAPVVNF